MHEETSLDGLGKTGYRKTEHSCGGQETGRLAHGNPWLAKRI